MKKDIHPKYYPNAKVTCACGNEFNVGSTQPEISTEICSMCHPFFTGKQKLIDTSRRVEKFQERLAKKDTAAAGRKGKKVKRLTKSKKQTTKKNNKEK